MSDSDPKAHFSYFIEQLSQRKLAYLHVLEGDMMTQSRTLDYRALRDLYNGIYIANCGYDLEKGQSSIASGDSDLVAYGVPFLANPDLVERFQRGQPLNEADQATFYGGDETGYTDYPFA
jgi:N-ethylmaleimide reductase